MMEIPSGSSNSHPAPPLLRLGVFTPLIDSLSLFPFQESLGFLSTRLTFPRTSSSFRSRGILDSVGYIPTVLSRATWWQGPFNTVGVSNEGLTQNATEKYTERCLEENHDAWSMIHSSELHILLQCWILKSKIKTQQNDFHAFGRKS